MVVVVMAGIKVNGLSAVSSLFVSVRLLVVAFVSSVSSDKNLFSDGSLLIFDTIISLLDIELFFVLDSVC